jgi:hypothetical protein
VTVTNTARGAVEPAEQACRRDQPPPRTLLEQIIRDSRRTIEENCAAFEKTARMNGESATLSPRTLQRWMAGEVPMARPVMQRVAKLHWGYDFEELVGPPESDNDAGAQSDQPRNPNHLLRRARLGRLSPSGSGRRMSRQDLAEAVNAHVFASTGRVVSLAANYVGKLERGEHRWPTSDYRAGFRAVLEAATDAELGFYVARRSPDDDFILSEGLPAVDGDAFPVPVVHREVAAMRLVIAPGTAVIVVPADHPVLLALVASDSGRTR